MKIVAIDDEKFILAELVDVLKETLPEAELMSFSRASEAWEYIQNNPVDYIFTDRQMPGLSGIELGNLVCAKYPETEVFIMSAEPAATLRREGIPLERCIFKPYTPKAILDKVNNKNLPPFHVGVNETPKESLKEASQEEKKGFFSKLFK